MGKAEQKIDEVEIKPKKEDWFDDKKTLTERKQLFSDFMNTQMNPDDEFNPETWDPMKDLPESELVDRTRKVPPKQLPTFNIKPKEFREGQMIGMYETKQDIYLTMAHRCNELQNEIDALKIIVTDLQTQINK